MPIIDVPVATGKATKLVLSVDAALNSDLIQYCEFVKDSMGAEVAVSYVAKQMLKKCLDMDKDFAAWKKKKPAPSRAAEAAPNGVGVDA